MRKITVLFLILAFLNCQAYPLYAYTQIPAFLCEMGVKFYQQGRYDEALHEFQKALLIKPDYEPAIRYIQMIEQREIATIPAPAPTVPAPLDLEKGWEKIVPEFPAKKLEAITTPLPKLEEKIIPTKIINLDAALEKLPLPIEIAQGEKIAIVGKNIQRFLTTEPNLLEIEKENINQLTLTGKDIGYATLYIWDEQGRWALEFLGLLPKPEGLSYEEALRRELETGGTFKLRYNLDWFSSETGRRLTNLERSGYSWAHGLSLLGETPYGNIDSYATIRRIKTTENLTYFTLGLSNGRIGPFKDFTLRGFDYAIPFSNLAVSASLRGAMLASPAFDKKINYKAFWGREGGGRYGNLSPNLLKMEDSFLNGLNLSYSPSSHQTHEFTIAHGWGEDRETHLNPYAYDLKSRWNFAQGGLGYEIGYNSETFAYLLNARYQRPRLNLSTEFRNVSKNYLNINNGSWRQGQLGALFNLYTAPWDNWGINSVLDVYLDRLYLAEDNDDRWNEDFRTNIRHQIDPVTALDFDYSLQNDLGRISQSRFQTFGLGLSRTFKLIRDISTYLQYNHQDNKNYSSHSSDYINDRLYGGLRFNILGELYYYLNKELNYLDERFTASHATPHALETGLDFTGQIGNSPWHNNLRFTYRDEENTVSNLSFLSGEDYIEGFAELSYKPKSGKEMYCSARVRNVWQDNPAINKRIETTFNAGMRLLWDTGFRWEAATDIEGYVFKDLNSDGLRQTDEPPVEKIKLWLGKEKFQDTDILGYYKFKGVKARRAFVNLDPATLPTGFVVTVPVTQEVTLTGGRVRVDFGITSRSEISGFIFEDADGNGVYGKDDKSIQGAIITLEDGKQATTDASGRYSFSTVAVGEHTLTLDLNSLPIYYLPKAPITQKVTLSEGVTYHYNIPLKKIEQ